MHHLTDQYKTWLVLLAANILSLAVVSHAYAENCTIHLNKTTIDYGQLNRANLLSTAQTGKIALGKRLLTLNIHCQESTPFALQFHAPAADQNTFRFSNTGNFSVSLSQAQVDGKAVMLASTKTAATPLNSIAAIATLEANQTVTAMANSLPISGKNFTAQVEVEAHIAPSTLRVREVTSLEGLGKFVMVQP